MDNELTTQEWKLIYDAVERRLAQVEDMASIQTSERFKSRFEKRIKELDNILTKIGERTI